MYQFKTYSSGNKKAYMQPLMRVKALEIEGRLMNNVSGGGQNPEGEGSDPESRQTNSTTSSQSVWSKGW